MQHYERIVYLLDRIYKETGFSYETFLGIEWGKISQHQNISEDFIREFKDKLDWGLISTTQKLSENFIREFKDYVFWPYISSRQKLSENFIREFKNNVCWAYICQYQKLSENFISEFKHDVFWYYISKYQILSENFIKDFKDLLPLDDVVKYQKLSKEFIKNDLSINKLDKSWLNVPAKFKKDVIVKTGLYECHCDHFIAYKSVRKDRYSHLNFQYQYLKGETYECHCDTTEEENSFGFSAWTKEKAKNYNDKGLIIKVKIKYEDVGRIVHKGGKIRCFKFEILD